MTESIAAPGAPRTRDTLPDLLRGVALLGIVVVNAPYLGSSAEGFSAASVAGTLDAVVAFAVVALAQGKFYLLFSFLFGYSLAYVLRDDRPSGRTRYRRRLVVLAVLGVAHAALLFVGDILLTYALLGALLLRFSRADVPRLLRASRITFALGAGLLVVVLGLAAGLAAAFSEQAAVTGPAVVAYDASMATATFAEATMLRLGGLPAVLGSILFVQGPLAFAAFLLGLAAARRRLLADPGAHGDLWRRLTRFGIGVGLPLQLIAAALQVGAIRAGTPYATAGSLGVMLGFVTAPLLSAGYLGLLAGRLVRDPGFMRWAWPAGRPDVAHRPPRPVRAAHARVQRHGPRAVRQPRDGGRRGDRRRHVGGADRVRGRVAAPLRPRAPRARRGAGHHASRTTRPFARGSTVVSSPHGTDPADR